MFKKNKLLALIISIMMIISLTPLGVFAAENDIVILEDALLVGAAPYAGAQNVAVGSNSAPQPIRIALSEGAGTVAANVGDYITITNVTTGGNVEVNASVDGKIVVLTPASPLSDNTPYLVDFNQEYLPEVVDYIFTTSKGGTGGGSGTGGGGGQQSLYLTGAIPFNDNYIGVLEGAPVFSAGQNLYATFSNSLLPGKENHSGITDLKGHNLGQIKVVDMDDQPVNAAVEITDNWTVKVSTANLSAGTYQIQIGSDLTANNGKKLGATTNEAGATITFAIAQSQQ